MNRNYQICTRCIMDTSDPEIIFDEEGVCNHCHKFDGESSLFWFPNAEGESRLKKIFDEIKKKGAGQEYDCILGLSGGVDSSYLAIQLKESGLRPLVVHVDAGWNSELSVNNIEKIVKHCNYELYTRVMDWSEIKDLQKAYLKSGVANQDVVQDHAFFSSLYHFAVKNKIKYVISGGNIATESVFPKSWHHSAMDAISLKDIHKRFGQKALKDYKTISFFKYYIYYPFVKKMRTVRPLNFMPYDKAEALKFLQDTIGYKPYAHKHGESRFTKFFQNYYLPNKFNIDKRRAHYSSMILSGQMSREQGLEQISAPLYDISELNNDMAYIAKKIGLLKEELHLLCEPPGHSYCEYKNWDYRYKFLKFFQKLFAKLFGKNIKNYS